jgi:hypothetical protein
MGHPPYWIRMFVEEEQHGALPLDDLLEGSATPDLTRDFAHDLDPCGACAR